MRITAALESIVERLTTMAEYAEHSLSPYQDTWSRIDALRQMLRGEIARINLVQQCIENKENSLVDTD